jgi:hypothetical protein
MEAWDVLSWIAFGKIRPRPDSDEDGRTYRWGHSWVAPTLAAPEARASDNPCYIVQPVTLDDQPWDRKSYVHPAFSPEAPQWLRRLRAKARKREGRLVSYTELAAMLRAEVAANAEEDSRVTKVRHDLLEALRASKLTAWGKRDARGGEPNPAAERARPCIRRGMAANEVVEAHDGGFRII